MLAVICMGGALCEQGMARICVGMLGASSTKHVPSLPNATHYPIGCVAVPELVTNADDPQPVNTKACLAL